ncbi:hypothetical protein ACERIT_05730 [Halopenitus sp. H-Gu1]
MDATTKSVETPALSESPLIDSTGANDRRSTDGIDLAIRSRSRVSNVEGR